MFRKRSGGAIANDRNSSAFFLSLLSGFEGRFGDQYRRSIPYIRHLCSRLILSERRVDDNAGKLPP
jgi:hypothetical protein